MTMLPASAHDPMRMAQFAADDLAATDRVPVADHVAVCSACSALATDLAAIARATRELPPPRRRRDFRLTRADVACAHDSTWRRLLRSLASPRSISRPLATGFTTLGLCGLLLAATPSVPSAGTPAVGAARDAGSWILPSRTGDEGAPGKAADATAETTQDTLLVLSGSFLISGLGLAAMRWAGRRLGGG
jgi:hypothetical protein